MRPSKARVAAALAGTTGLAITLAVAGSSVATSASAAPSTSLVISEAYGGGGNSGAAFQNDFIELQNVGTATSDLTGWSVQYISASPGATTTWQVTPLSGSVAKGAHFLVGEAAGTGTAPALPTPDLTGSINLSGTGGTVALVHGTDPLTCKTADTCKADATIVDLVGWNTAVIRETADAPATTNATSVQRIGTTDTDDNSKDFQAAAPTPTPSGADTGGGDQPGPLRIHDIQGAAWVSPQKDAAVTNVPGVVTALRTRSTRGFWMQDPDPDNDPATSEGVFVYTSSTPKVAVGDSVLVSGKVSDYYPAGDGLPVSDTSDLSVTEITAPQVAVLSSGNPLPAPIVLGPDTVPTPYAPDLGGTNIEKSGLHPQRSALDFYESIEGMRVEVDDARVVGPSNKYGEQYVTTKPTDAASYRGGVVLLGENQTPAGRLEVVPLDGSNPAADVGDVFRGATVGPLDWSHFGGYVLQAAQLGTVEHNGLPRVRATAGTSRELSVATYNVENLAPSDPQAKFDTLAQGVVTNLASPDVVSLEEIQDNSGATDDGTVAADQTLTKLTDAIVAAGGPRYAWREIDPVNDQDGGQPGGNIRVAFLFDPNRVSFVDRGDPAVDRSTTGTQVVKYRGRPALSLSPGRIDPANPVWSTSRKPLVGQFRFRGEDVFVIANHFDSKGGDQNADGRFQYPAQSSATQRAGQALVVHDFVDRLQELDKRANVIVLGDLNDYQFSPALSVLRTGTADGTGPANLVDLITTLPADQQYTYVYDGVSQVLDHILLSPRLDDFRYQVVHVNAEYHDQASDHDPQVVDVRI